MLHRTWKPKCVTSICIGLAIIASTILLPKQASAEDCVVGVHIMLPWTAPLVKNAKEWPADATAKKFPVDHVLTKNCVLVYPGNYGHGISTLGHVARIVNPIPDKHGKIEIQDSYEASPGYPAKTREIRLVTKPDMAKCSVIHPKP